MPPPPLVSAQVFIFLSGILSRIGYLRFMNVLDNGLENRYLQDIIPVFRTILKESNNAKLLFPFLFSDPETILVLSDALDLAFWTACNSGFGSIIFH